MGSQPNENLPLPLRDSCRVRPGRCYHRQLRRRPLRPSLGHRQSQCPEPANSACTRSPSPSTRTLSASCAPMPRTGSSRRSPRSSTCSRLPASTLRSSCPSPPSSPTSPPRPSPAKSSATAAASQKSTRARPFASATRPQPTCTAWRHLGRDLAFRVHGYSPYILRGGPVSSSRIRTLISAGQVSRARALLGRPFAIRSTPASGRGYGTRYTVPTINLATYPELLPGIGVYITALKVADDLFQAVTNVGNRPTFGADSFTVESHILNFHPVDLTEETPLELTFLHRLRDEIRFPSPEALLAQIKRDVHQANRFFALANRWEGEASASPIDSTD